MSPQSGHGIAVQTIAGHSVTHQIEPALAVLPLGQAHLRFRNGSALQAVDDIVVDSGHFRKFQAETSFFCAQGASSSSHTHSLELAVQLFLQPVCNLPGHLGYLGNVLNLPVQHGPLAVLFLLHCQHPKAFVLYPADNSDNAAGTNIQCENHFTVLGCSL